MSNPYLRFMNGDMPFWDFVSEMGGQQQQPQAGRERGPPGPHGQHPPPYGFGGWSPFDMPSPPNDDMWGGGGFGPGPHPFAHRPHPRHRGRYGPQRGHHGPDHGGNNNNSEQALYSDNDEEVNTPPETPHDRKMGDNDEKMGASEGTITLQDNEKMDRDDGQVPNPDISTPADGGEKKAPHDKDGEGEDSPSDSDCDHPHHHHHHHHPGHRHGWGGGPGGWHHGGHGRWAGRGRCGGFGGRGGRHHHHPYEHPFFRGGPWMHGGPRHGPFGGGGPGHRGGPPHCRRHNRGGSDENDANNGAPGFDELFRAFGRDPRFQGIGEMIGNVLRATGGMMYPNGQRTRASNHSYNPSGNPDVDFQPPADIYDTPDAYLVHLALPGARREDVSVSWDGAARELRVAGLVARDGDEAHLQALAMAERDVGVFERVLSLPGPDRVDAPESVEARMADGILHVTVPKQKRHDRETEEETGEPWTEVHSVDVL